MFKKLILHFAKKYGYTSPELIEKASKEKLSHKEQLERYESKIDALERANKELKGRIDQLHGEYTPTDIPLIYIDNEKVHGILEDSVTIYEPGHIVQLSLAVNDNTVKRLCEVVFKTKIPFEIKPWE